MSKNKKKPSKQNINKVSLAHYKNEFIGKLKSLCVFIAGSNDILKLITEKDFERLYNIRNQPFKVLSAKGHDINPQHLKIIKYFISNILKSKKVKILPDFDKEITIDEYLTVGLTLTLYINELRLKDDSKTKEIHNKLQKYNDYESRYHDAWQWLFKASEVSCFILSDYEHAIYCYKFEIRTEIEGRLGLFNCMDIYSYKPEITNVTLDGYNRPAFQLGWAVPIPNPFLI